MLKRRKNGERGFTLAELLVVLAIGAVLTAFAIPAISNLGLFARDELKGTARDVFSLLQAARIYASTHAVNTAVVYTMDSYVSRDENPNNDPGIIPVIDSVTGQNIRSLVAVAVMYRLPTKSGPFAGRYVPVPGEEGIFRYFQGGMVIPLELSKRFGDDVRVISPVQGDPGGPVYSSDLPRLAAPAGSTAEKNLAYLGLTPVPVYPEDRGARAPGGPNLAELEYVEFFPAHVFSKDGELVSENTALSWPREKVTFWVAPPMDLIADDRLDNFGKLLSIPIEITRLSGRVKIATEN